MASSIGDSSFFYYSKDCYYYPLFPKYPNIVLKKPPSFLSSGIDTCATPLVSPLTLGLAAIVDWLVFLACCIKFFAST